MSAATRRFTRDSWAVVGLVFLVLLGLAALGAPFLVPHVLHASA